MAPRPLPLIVLDGMFAVCRLAPDAALPPGATNARFFSITRTCDELSIVCPEENVSTDVRCERGWRCLRVAGSMDFALVGVLASLVTPLAEAGIALFAFSTFDTDYVMVKAERFEQALEVLRKAEHNVA